MSEYLYPKRRVVRQPGSRLAQIERGLIEEMARLGWVEGDHSVRGRLTNVRFLFYRLESLEVVPKALPGAKQPSQYVSEVMTGLREAAVFPLDCLVDENRGIEWHRGWPNVLDGARAQIEYLSLDPWAGDAAVPFLIVESRSLAGTLRDLADEFRVNMAALGGQSSLPLCNEIAQALPSWSRAIILTDLDKSGGDIERSAFARIRAYRQKPLELAWDRLAITEEQVVAHDLTVIQKYDGRTKRRHPAVETEALGQDEIERIARKALEESLAAHGHESLDAIRAEEERQRHDVRKRLGADGS